MPEGNFHISPQEPDSTISTLLRTDSSVFEYNFIVEEPDSFSGSSGDTLIQAGGINDSTVLSSVRDTDSVITEIPAREIVRTEEPVTVRTETVVEDNDTFSGIKYDPDTIAFLSPDIPGYEAFSRNFLYNMPHTKPLKEKSTGKKTGAEQIKTRDQKINRGTKEYTEKAGDTKNLQEKEITDTSNDWMIGALLFTLFIFAWLRLFYKKHIFKTIVATYNTSVLNKMFRESNSVSQRVAFALNLVFIVNIGLFIFQVTDYYDIKIFNYNNFITFLIFCGIVIGIYIIKYLAYNILGFIFLAQKYFSEYLHSIFIYNKTLGLLLFPVVIGIPYMPDSYTPTLVNAGIALFIAGFLFRIMRGGQICIKINVSIFYMFLYLCTLEITPMFFFYKFLTSYI